MQFLTMVPVSKSRIWPTVSLSTHDFLSSRLFFSSGMDDAVLKRFLQLGGDWIATLEDWLTNPPSEPETAEEHWLCEQFEKYGHLPGGGAPENQAYIEDTAADGGSLLDTNIIFLNFGEYSLVKTPGSERPIAYTRLKNLDCYHTAIVRGPDDDIYFFQDGEWSPYAPERLPSGKHYQIEAFDSYEPKPQPWPALISHCTN